MTRLEQLQKNGIKRLGTPKRGFRYQDADGKKVSATDRKRVEGLKIPPAGRLDIIHARLRLQVVGKDAAGTLAKYLYHETNTRRQDAKKFRRILAFAEALQRAQLSPRICANRPSAANECGRSRILSAASPPGRQVVPARTGVCIPPASEP